jgi:hypothetical protein
METVDVNTNSWHFKLWNFYNVRTNYYGDLPNIDTCTYIKALLYIPFIGIPLYYLRYALYWIFGFRRITSDKNPKWFGIKLRNYKQLWGMIIGLWLLFGTSPYIYLFITGMRTIEAYTRFCAFVLCIPPAIIIACLIAGAYNYLKENCLYSLKNWLWDQKQNYCNKIRFVKKECDK